MVEKRRLIASCSYRDDTDAVQALAVLAVAEAAPLLVVEVAYVSRKAPAALPLAFMFWAQRHDAMLRCR